VTIRLARLLAAFVDERDLGRVLENGSVELPSGDTPGPDTMYFSDETWRAAAPHEEGKIPRAVPDLVVEVLSDSTSTYDRGEKKAIYEKNGVREYWIVDPKKIRVARFVHDGSRFGAPTVFEIDDTFESTVIEEFRFLVRKIAPRR
jgi:Uma2 family endonuclease